MENFVRGSETGTFVSIEPRSSFAESILSASPLARAAADSENLPPVQLAESSFASGNLARSIELRKPGGPEQETAEPPLANPENTDKLQPVPMPRVNDDKGGPDAPPAPTDNKEGEPPALPPPEENGERSVRLADGSLNVFDAAGRVIMTQSADGVKTREFKYEDPNNPERITDILIDHHRHYVRNSDGNSWNVDMDGQFMGVWYGDTKMTRQAVYSYDDHTNGQHCEFGADTKRTQETFNPPQRPAVPVVQDGSNGMSSYPAGYAQYDGSRVANGGYYAGDTGYDGAYAGAGPACYNNSGGNFYRGGYGGYGGFGGFGGGNFGRTLGRAALIGLAGAALSRGGYGMGMGYGMPFMGGMGYGMPFMGGMGYGMPFMGGMGYGMPFMGGMGYGMPFMGGMGYGMPFMGGMGYGRGGWGSMAAMMGVGALLGRIGRRRW